MTHPAYDAALARAARREASEPLRFPTTGPIGPFRGGGMGLVGGRRPAEPPDSTWARPVHWSGEPVMAHKIARGHGDIEAGDGALSFLQFGVEPGTASVADPRT